MQWYQADLHIHSCLSPCGDLSASPRMIADYAADTGIDLIALTDHNSSLNCPSFAYHAQSRNFQALFGMEATCAEEAHCLCIFGTLATAMDFSQFAERHLPKVQNDPERAGDQVWVDIHENIEGSYPYYLPNALDLGLSDLCTEVHRRDGLFIPAHIDRNAMSLLSQLGRVPFGNWDALEQLHIFTPNEQLMSDWPAPRTHGNKLPPAALEALTEILINQKLMCSPHWTDAIGAGACVLPSMIASSDAHEPHWIGQRRTLFWAETPSFEGLRQALHQGYALAAWSTEKFKF